MHVNLSAENGEHHGLESSIGSIQLDAVSHCTVWSVTSGREATVRSS